MTPRTSYQPGSALLLPSTNAVFFGDIATDSPLGAALLELAGGPLDPTAILRILTSDGLDGLPDFAMAWLDERGWHVLCRGATECEWTTSSGVIESLNGASVATWNERALDAPAQIRLAHPTVTASSTGWLPVLGGVVLAANCRLDIAELPSPGPAAAEPDRPPLVNDTSDPKADAAAIEPPERPLAGQFDRLFSNDETMSRSHLADSDPPAASPPEPSQPEPAAAVDDDDLTLMPEPEPEPAPEPASEAKPAPQSDAASQAAPAAQREHVTELQAGLITSVPWGGDAAAPITPEPTPAPELKPLPPPTPSTFSGRVSSEDELGNLTTRRNQLSAATPETNPVVGPTVLAARCPARHYTPLYAQLCRVCGEPVSDQEPITISRPVLGVLRFSTGALTRLDRGVILGREPSIIDPTESERPHLVKLASPDRDISRNHARVELHGWHVLVTDLDSANGTFIATPGEEPFQLRPHEPTPIEPGTTVTLSDQVSLTYEVAE